ncbi:MAG: GAF domain-containing protein [Candidatus Marinimicrobia bacterium]|nr:GAF domain-containing protein [Candidatus Neomarinimicrobiota bacterium]
MQKIILSSQTRDEKLLNICQLLKDAVLYYDWVGFYMAEQSKQELVLGPYVGAPTEHTRIPYGKGICGQAADKRDTIIVQDISGQTNYLSCSIDVRSEIVVPVFKDGRFVAELDIDSHELNQFSEKDKKYLELVCQRVSVLF